MQSPAMDISVRVLCAQEFQVLSVIYLGVELLGHKVTQCLTFRGNAKLFSNVAMPFHVPTNSVQRFQSLHILVDTCFVTFWTISIFVGMKCVISISIALMIHDTEYSPCAYWPFVYLLWRLVYSDPLTGYLSF